MPEGREVIWPDGLPKPPAHSSPVIKAGGWIFVAGQLATDFEHGLAPEARLDPRTAYRGEQLEHEAHYVMRNLGAALAAAGADIASDVMRIYQWYASPYPTMEELAEGNTWPRMSNSPYHRVRNAVMRQPQPASTSVTVRRMPVTDTTLTVDLIAFDPGIGESTGFPVPDGVPAPVSKYSPAIRRGDWVFLAGDIPSDWRGDFGRADHHGEPSALAPDARLNPYLWYGSPIELQTDYTLEKLSKIAAAAGTSLERCVKAEVYLAHPSDWYGMERAWRRWFPENPPARVIVPYTGLGGRGSRIEIAMALLADDSSLSIDTIETSGAPEPVGHEPQAVKAGDFVFFSSLLPVDSDGAVPAGLLPDPQRPFYSQPARAQMHAMLAHADAICRAAGTSLDQACRGQVFVDDLARFPETIDEWRGAFDRQPPASATMEVGGPLIAPGAHLMLDLVVYAG
jgi:enamine deaminase RidA (YjgF/YER057c/UK114 family)